MDKQYGIQFPMINCSQKIVIYETKARYFVVGSNSIETRFRVLKIDRTEAKELHVTDDKVEYTQREIRDLLLMIDVGNRPKTLQKGNAGLSRTVSAFGIVGFVRFLEGYYMILITKRRKIALIGAHTIYKIEDTSMIYIPNDVVRYTHPDEQRYVKMFQNTDLSSNFYFSYSYDLTHTLQHNLSPCKDFSTTLPTDPKHSLKFWKTGQKDGHVHSTPKLKNDVEDAKESVPNFLESTDEKNMSGVGMGKMSNSPDEESEIVYGVRNEPYYKFAWNHYLLKDVLKEVHPDWVLYIIHGFIGQSNLSVFGKSLYLTLIGRRSSQFAGTRFLKRGANSKGCVANEVETEQIVHDASITSFHRGHFTSFVQLRGSIPLHWSQDIAKMVPKPPIALDQTDPYGYIAGAHFNQVLRRYGAPIIILNLVKKREKKKHESILSEEFVAVLKYLNQFLPEQYGIKYIGFDMAKFSKSKSANVLLRLAKIAESCVKKTGFFSTGPGLYCNQIRLHQKAQGMPWLSSESGHIQNGVVRTNCVDCLDRTNTAQFAVGKCALGVQLMSLGVIDDPELEFDTDCVRMLEELYEDQGDTLALQYGGSQLVHRIKGYRKIAPWTSSSRDIMMTLSRYYSNAFSDAEKQHALNLFLGIFSPKEGQPNLWELPTDIYLHNPYDVTGSIPRPRSYTQWWDTPVIKSLPKPYEDDAKGIEGHPFILKTHQSDERVDSFWDHYKPYELTSFEEHYSFHMPNSVRDFMPKFSKSCSPFALRVRPGRRQEESGAGSVKSLLLGPVIAGKRAKKQSATETNPNVSGKDSTSSTTSTGSEGTSTSSDGSDIDGDIDMLNDCEISREDSGFSYTSLKDLFPTMKQTYGVEIKDPSKPSNAVYRRYVQIGENATPNHQDENKTKKIAKKGTNLVQISSFSMDSIYGVVPPRVSSHSKEIYKTYVKRGKEGAGAPTKRDIAVYYNYGKSKYL